jgi:hypothetical protein
MYRNGIARAVSNVALAAVLSLAARLLGIDTHAIAMRRSCSSTRPSQRTGMGCMRG